MGNLIWTQGSLLTAGPSGSLTGTAGANPFGSILSLLGAIAVLVLVLFLAYKCTRLMGRHYSLTGGQGSGMTVIDRMPLGTDRTLMVVRVGERVLLLGVTPHHIENLAELDPDSYSDITAAVSAEGITFSSLLKGTLNRGADPKTVDKKESQDE